MDRWAGVPYVDEGRFRTRGAVVPTARRAADDAPLPDADRAMRARALEEERLALVARHTDDAIVLYGADGRIDWVNDAFVRMTGYDLDETVGAWRQDLIRGPFTRTPEYARLAEDLIAQRETSLEFVTRTKAGASYWTAMRIRPARVTGGASGGDSPCQVALTP